MLFQVIINAPWKRRLTWLGCLAPVVSDCPVQIHTNNLVIVMVERIQKIILKKHALPQ